MPGLASIHRLKPRQCSLALSNSDVRGTLVLFPLHYVQGCLWPLQRGEWEQGFRSRKDMGSSPAKVPGMQPARKAYPSYDHIGGHCAQETAGSPMARWSPDGFSLKTVPENLCDPGKPRLGHCSSLASRKQAAPRVPCGVPSKSLLIWACFSICNELTGDLKTIYPTPHPQHL